MAHRTRGTKGKEIREKEFAYYRVNLTKSFNFLSVPFSFSFFTFWICEVCFSAKSYFIFLAHFNSSLSYTGGRNDPQLSGNLEWIQSSEAEC